MNKAPHNEHINDNEGVPTRSANERVKDALNKVQASLESAGAVSELIRQDPEYRRARELAIVYLSYGPKSSGKVRDKLIDKQVDPEMAQQVTSTLIRDAYIDDRRIARQLLSERRTKKAEGYRKAEQRLISNGIPRYIAVEIIEEEREAYPEINLLAAFLKSKFKKELRWLRDLDSDTEEAETMRIRMIRAAQGRGFNHSDCFRLFALWKIGRS